MPIHGALPRAMTMPLFAGLLITRREACPHESGGDDAFLPSQAE